MVRIEQVIDPSAMAEEIAEVYRSAFSIFRDGPREEEVRTFTRQTLPRHMERETFRFIAASDDDGELIGFIYGYHGRPGEWWEDWIAQRLPAPIFEEWFACQFDLTEFCVRFERQRAGIGSSLYEAMFRHVAATPYERAVLTTRRRVDNPARRFYARRGWEVVWDALDDRFSLFGLRLR